MLCALGLLGAAACTPASGAPAASAPSSAASTQAIDALPRPRLIRSQTDVFAVERGRRRLVTTPQVLADHRWSLDWVEQIPEDELTRIGLGPDLVAGPLLRAPDGALWVVYLGTRRLVVGPDALGPLREQAEDALPVTQSLLDSYAPGRPVGNPPRPWLIVLPIALLGAGAGLWWYSSVTSSREVRRWQIAYLTLLGVSTAARLFYVTLYPWLPDGPDAETYAAASRMVAQFGPLWHDPPVATLSHITSPLYPMVLAVLSPFVFVSGGSAVGWKVAQVFASVALVAVVWDLARRVYGPAAARCAALVATLSPLWLYSAELVQYEIWLALLITSSLWCLVRWEPQRGIGLPGGRWLWAGAVLAGLAALMQLKAAVLWAPAVAYLLHRGLNAYRGRGVALSGRFTVYRSAALAPLLFVLIAVVPPGSWGLRNVVVQQDFILGSTGSGGLLWMGSQPGATGGYMQLPRPDAFYDKLAQHPTGSLRSRESKAYGDLALEGIAREPDRFLVLGLMKLERFWWTVTPERLGEFAEPRMTAFLGGLVGHTGQQLFSKLLNAVSIVLLSAGLLLGHRLSGNGAAAFSGRMLIVLAVAVFWLSHVPFISEPRYRIPIAPLLQVVQGAGLVLLGERVRRLRRSIAGLSSVETTPGPTAMPGVH